jgi:hypothetical protein
MSGGKCFLSLRQTALLSAEGKKNVGAGRVMMTSRESLKRSTRREEHNRLIFGNGACMEWCQRFKCVCDIPQLNCASRDSTVYFGKLSSAI